MIAEDTFNIEVNLTVFINKDEKGFNLARVKANPVFRSNGLKVDFAVKDESGFARMHVAVFNVSDSQLTALLGSNLYAQVECKQHGHVIFSSDLFLVNNTVDVIDLPNRIVTLYCYTFIDSDYLSKTITIDVDKPTPRRIISEVLKAVGWKQQVKFENFPSQNSDIDSATKRKSFPFSGISLTALQIVAQMIDARVSVSNSEIKMIHTPSAKKVKGTRQDPTKSARDSKGLDSPDIDIVMENLQGSPRVGYGTVSFSHVLDGRIAFGKMVNLSKVRSVTLDSTVANDATTNQGVAKVAAGKHSIYLVTAVTHKGSNFNSGVWTTEVTAIAPSTGKQIPLSWV